MGPMKGSNISCSKHGIPHQHWATSVVGDISTSMGNSSNMNIGRHRWGMDLFCIVRICLTCLNKSCANNPGTIEIVQNEGSVLLACIYCSAFGVFGRFCRVIIAVTCGDIEGWNTGTRRTETTSLTII